MIERKTDGCNNRGERCDSIKIEGIERLVIYWSIERNIYFRNFERGLYEGEEEDKVCEAPLYVHTCDLPGEPILQLYSRIPRISPAFAVRACRKNSINISGS